MTHEHTEGAFQLHPSWNHPCVPHSEAAAGFTLSHKPVLQLNTLHSKYFTGCSQQLWLCILTIRPPCWEYTSSLEQAELFLYIAHLFLIFFCLISNHFRKSFWQLLNRSLCVCFLHSRTECKCWAEGRTLTASEHFPHWTPEGGGGKDKWQGSRRTASKALKELIGHPSQIHFCNWTKTNSGTLSGDGAAEERLGRGNTSYRGKDPSALSARWILASSTFCLLKLFRLERTLRII